MAEQLHALKVYKVEYGKQAFSSYSKSAINQILLNYCETLYYEGEYIEYSNTLEADVDEFKKMIETIENMSDDEFFEIYESYREYNAIEVSREDFLCSMKALYDDCDKEDGFVHLHWF